MNLRPLGYERGETDPDGRCWTRLDGHSCGLPGNLVRRRPSQSGSVRRSLPTFCLHDRPLKRSGMGEVVVIIFVVHHSDRCRGLLGQTH